MLKCHNQNELICKPDLDKIFLYVTICENCLFYKPKPVQLPRVFRSGGNEIDPRCLDGGMPQYIRQFYDIPAHLIKNSGKQVAQIVGEHLGGRNLRLSAYRLHLRPNLLSGHSLSASGEKNFARSNFLLFHIFFQLSAQLSGDQDGAQLSFQ